MQQVPRTKPVSRGEKSTSIFHYEENQNAQTRKINVLLSRREKSKCNKFHEEEIKI